MSQHADEDETERSEHDGDLPDGSADGDASDGDGDGDEHPAKDAEPVYNDRDKLDFDPDEGLLSGTAIHGGTDIPGEHEMVDDVPMDEDGNATSKDADGDEDDDTDAHDEDGDDVGDGDGD